MALAIPSKKFQQTNPMQPRKSPTMMGMWHTQLLRICILFRRQVWHTPVIIGGFF
jgi:lysophospholipid acyltransferase (LPLAT)-like uncharacterized protein